MADTDNKISMKKGEQYTYCNLKAEEKADENTIYITDKHNMYLGNRLISGYNELDCINVASSLGDVGKYGGRLFYDDENVSTCVRNDFGYDITYSDADHRLYMIVDQVNFADGTNSGNDLYNVNYKRIICLTPDTMYNYEYSYYLTDEEKEKDELFIHGGLTPSLYKSYVEKTNKPIDDIVAEGGNLYLACFYQPLHKAETGNIAADYDDAYSNWVIGYTGLASDDKYGAIKGGDDLTITDGQVTIKSDGTFAKLISQVLYATFTLDGWTATDSGTYTQTVALEGMKEAYNPLLVANIQASFTAAERKAYTKNFSILSSSVGTTADGSVTFEVYEKLSADITVGFKGI